jgi:hypothetical protein
MAAKEMAVASSSSQGTPKKKLDHIRVRQAKNGGHMVEHHYNNSGMGPYQEPDVYAFGEGPEVVAHLNKHLGISENKQVSKMKGAGYTSTPGGKADKEVADKEPKVKQPAVRAKSETKGE